MRERSKMKKKNFGYLAGGLLLGAAGMYAFKYNGEKTRKKNVVKYLDLFRVMNQYVVTKQRHQELAAYFEEKGYRTIAIYGMSHIGQRVIDDLKDSNIEVLYGVDERADRLTYSLPIYKPSDELPQVDAIVVTAYDFDEIAEKLSEKVDFEILMFADIIFGI